MGIFNNLRERLTKTRDNLVNKIRETVSGKATLDPNTLEQLEEILISSDVGYDLSSRIIENVRMEMLNVKDRTNERIVFDVVKAELKKIFENNNQHKIKELSNYCCFRYFSSGSFRTVGDLVRTCKSRYCNK